MKKLLLFITLIFATGSAFAFRILYGNEIIISQPVNEDLYIAGGTVTINAPIHGDLIIAGGTIIINDTITNDILLAGGKATFNGFVGDDIRCAGGNIRISKNVTGDVLVTGGVVVIDGGITIGNLLASGGNITIDGNVMGEIYGVFGELILNGNVAKDIDCRGGKITINGNITGKSILAARQIVIGNHATFNNDIRYWSKAGSLDFNNAQKNGKATFDTSLRIRSGEWYYLGASTLVILIWYLGMALLMIFLVQYLFSATVKNAADNAFNNTLKSLGSGLLFFIAVPLAAIIAFITIIGVPVALLLIFSYIVLVSLSTTITSVVAANWINNRFNKQWDFRKLSFAAFGIFVLLKLVSLTPFLGWLIMCLMVCISFGSIIIQLSGKLKGTPKTANNIR